MQPVYLRQSALVSALGHGVEQHWQLLVSGQSAIQSLITSRLQAKVSSDLFHMPVAALSQNEADAIEGLRTLRSLRMYDQAALAGVRVAQDCAGGIRRLEDCHVVCGSSRGPTQSWEKSLSEFDEGIVRPQVSPSTTTGSLASAISAALGCGGGQSFISATCTTGLQVVGMGMAFLRSSQASEVLVTASEFSLTEFTLRQLLALGVYSKKRMAQFDGYRPYAADRDGMILGEGAAAAVLSSEPTSSEDIQLVGYGAASEKASATGLSQDGEALTQAVHKALENASLTPADIDAIVGHGSGTPQGDASELAAYQRIFKNQLPLLTAHKWAWGHVLGASGLMSLVIAAESLRREQVFGLPYADIGKRRETLRYMLVTALGFGGHAVAVILKKPS